MSWTAPKTFTANTLLTAADLNTYLRDNMRQMAPEVAKNTGGYFVVDGDNSLVERVPGSAQVLTSDSTTSTSFVDLATVGPSVTLDTGSLVAVWFAAQISNSGANQSRVGVDISGATTNPADDSQFTANTMAYGSWLFFSELSHGSNTFRLKYRASAGTATFSRRRILVMSM